MNWVKWISLHAAVMSFSLHVTAQSFTVDQQIGSEGAVQVANSIGHYQDSNLSAYVNAIGQRLVKYLGEQPFKYQFFVLDMAEPNAFALPGGYVYVSRGILALANSEDELAGVISHEIMHVHKRHGLQQAKKSILPGVIQLPGAIVGSVINEELGQVINTPAALGSGLLLSSYSRSHETEADELGVELMAAAGYEPTALPTILDHLHEEVEAITGEEETFSYFDSHPFTPNRVTNLIDRIQKGKVDVPEENKAFISSVDYKRLLENLPIGVNPHTGLFVDHQFAHPDINFYIQLPSSWQYLNQPVALFAADTNGEAQITIEAIPDSLSPAEYGRKAKKNMWENRGIKAEHSQLVTLDNQPGYLLTYTDSTEMGEVVAYAFWWQTPTSAIIRLTSIGLATHKDAIWSSIQSIGTIPKSLELTYSAIELEQTKEGEKLQDVAARRTDNTLSMSMLSAINGKPFDHIYSKGKLVKANR